MQFIEIKSYDFCIGKFFEKFSCLEAYYYTYWYTYTELPRNKLKMSQTFALVSEQSLWVSFDPA